MYTKTLPDQKQDSGYMLFTKSTKPAILFIEGEKPYYHLGNKYPFIEVNKNGWNIRIFFQNEELHKNFLNQLQTSKTSMEDFIRDDEKLGLLLGYPLEAVKQFADENNELFYGIVYHGMPISVTPEIVKETIVWLKDKYKTTPEMKTGIYVENEDGSKWVEIINDDFSVLEELKK